MRHSLLDCVSAKAEKEANQRDRFVARDRYRHLDRLTHRTAAMASVLRESQASEFAGWPETATGICLDSDVAVTQETSVVSDTEQTRQRETKGLRALSKVADRFIEIVIVFASVYAAFVLNAYQIRQQDSERRGQLLAYLRRDSADRARGLHELATSYDRDMNDFLDRLSKGEMPRIEPGSWATNFTGNEGGQLIQAGALDLLSIDTIAQMLNVDSLTQSGLAMMKHHERLDDEMIRPHVGEDRTYFYDPATKQLRPEFARYVTELKDGSRFLHTLSESRDRLAAQIDDEYKKFVKDGKPSPAR